MREPQYRPRNTIVLIIGTPSWETPIQNTVDIQGGRRSGFLRKASGIFSDFLSMCVPGFGLNEPEEALEVRKP